MTLLSDMHLHFSNASLFHENFPNFNKQMEKFCCQISYSDKSYPENMDVYRGIQSICKMLCIPIYSIQCKTNLTKSTVTVYFHIFSSKANSECPLKTYLTCIFALAKYVEVRYTGFLLFHLFPYTSQII